MCASRTDHRNAIGQLLLASLCWSLGGLLIKEADWPPLAVAGGRGLIAALFLLLTTRPLRFTWRAPQLIGAFFYAATTILFVTATKLTTAANAILLQYTAPVWIALLGAWLLGERATRADWFTIAAVLGGMTLFFTGKLEASHLTGNLVAIGAGIAFAGMTIALRRQRDGGAAESIVLGNIIAFVVGVPWMFTSPLPSATGIGAIVVLGIVQLGMSYWLYARAIRHVTALEAVLIPVVEPLLNPVWVLLAQGERPSVPALFGGAIVLGAVTARGVLGQRASGASAPPAAPARPGPVAEAVLPAAEPPPVRPPAP